MLLEIGKFKKWALNANKTFVEWETEYQDWDRIYYFVNEVGQNVPFEKWNLEQINEFMYILARDNECEIIINTLIEHPNHLLSIARHAVSYPDHDARWQVAYGLGEVKDNGQEIKTLLELFLLDKHEYVRRRASFAYERKGFKL